MRAAQPEPRELPRAALAAQAAVARVLEATVTDHAARAGGFEHERAAQHGAFLAAELDGHPQPCLRATWLVERARARQVLAAAQHDALPRHGDAQRRDEGGTVVRHDQRDVAHDRQEQVARRSDALDRGGGGAAQARVRGGGQCAQDVGPVRDGRHRPSLSWSSSTLCVPASRRTMRRTESFGRDQHGDGKKPGFLSAKAKKQDVNS